MAGAARLREARGGAADGTLYAPAEAVRAWHAQAAVGHRMIYAHGPALDPAHETAALVSAWIAAGEVVSYKTRVNGVLAHGVQRGAPAPRAVAAERRRLPAGFWETREGRLLAVLIELAKAGAPCPANRELARRAGLRDAEAVKYRLRRLRAQRLIATSRPGEPRVVTILYGPHAGAKTSSQGCGA